MLCLLALYACRSEKYAEGKRIYQANCSNCHMDDGSGLGRLIPPLYDQNYLTQNEDNLVCIILNGQQGPIVVNDNNYNGIMPAAELSDVQILNLINYFTNEWGNDMGYTTITEIQKRKKNCD